jgi:hypothetical protein
MSFGILYDGFLIRPDIGYSYEERDYKIDISPKTGSSTDSKTIKINKDMT